VATVIGEEAFCPVSLWERVTVRAFLMAGSIGLSCDEIALI
jgi:hypothetical protein